MRLIPQDTMSQYSTNFLLLPIPEYPVLDCVPNKIIKLVVLGGSSVGKTGKPTGVLRALCLLLAACDGGSDRPKAVPSPLTTAAEAFGVTSCLCLFARCLVCREDLLQVCAASQCVGTSVLTNESPGSCAEGLTSKSPLGKKWG